MRKASNVTVSGNWKLWVTGSSCNPRPRFSRESRCGTLRACATLRKKDKHMPKQTFFKSKKLWMICVLVIITAVPGALYINAQSSGTQSRLIAYGAGTTIVEGGTGPGGGNIPVLTTLAFRAERKDGVIVGDLECMARV